MTGTRRKAEPAVGLDPAEASHLVRHRLARARDAEIRRRVVTRVTRLRKWLAGDPAGELERLMAWLERKAR